MAEINEAILLSSEIIENYPQDKYEPGCLMLGFTKAGKARHVHFSYPDRQLLKIITVASQTLAFGRTCG